MSIERAFPPYEGDEPYLFVSYAHADSPEVMPVITALHERGFRIWYDEGIEVGSEWPECIAQHLAGSALVLAFLSNAYIASDNCRREMHFALTKRIRGINIFLERTALTPGMEMQVGSRFALMKYEMDETLFLEKLLSAPLLAEAGVCGPATRPERRKAPKKLKKAAKPRRDRKKRRAGLITALLALLLLAGAALGIVGHFTGLTERVRLRLTQEPVQALPGETVAAFESPLFEKAARAWTGQESGELRVDQLAGVTELWLCGDEVFFSEPDALPDSAGTLTTLADLRFFPELQKLVLRAQPLTDLKTLPAHELESLSVLDGQLASLEGVGRLCRLRELVTDGCPVRELGDLGRCLELRRMSLLGAAVKDYGAVRPLIRLTEVSLSNGNLDSIGEILDHGALTSLYLENCDLRGRFFKSFDSERRLVTLTLDNCRLSTTDNVEDFTGLAELTLRSTGEDLDWSTLAGLPSLRRVTVDAAASEAIRHALEGTDVSIKEE